MASARLVTTGMTVRLTAALQGLDRALDAPRQQGIALGNWRWVVRQRMTAVRDALAAETTGPDDGWLAARGGTAFRERNVLLDRLNRLGHTVLECERVEEVRVELKRLVVDVRHHVQRLHDLAADEAGPHGVGLELGGSE